MHNKYIIRHFFCQIPPNIFTIFSYLAYLRTTVPFVTAHLEIFHSTHHPVIPKSDLYFTFCSTLRTFIGVKTAALTFLMKQYSTSYSSHISYGKRFCNDCFLNHNTLALVHNCFRNYSAVWSLKLLWTE